MKRMFAILTAATGIAILALAPSPVFAATNQCAVSQALQHALGGFFNNCPDASPVAGFAYALSGSTTTNAQATINTGTVPFVCNDNTGVSGSGAACQFESGTPGDGNVTVQWDWNNTVGNNIGCPDPTGAANFGRNILQVIANNGASLLLSVGFSTDLGEYVVDFAQQQGPIGPAGTPSVVPLSCNITEGGLKINSQTATPTSYTVSVTVPAPHMHTDCDPNTFGNVGNLLAFTPTCDATVPPTAPGKVYTTTFTCGKSPDMTLSSTANPWVAGPALDATGSTTLTVNRPAVATPPNCVFIAASGMVSGVETLAATGAIEVQGQGAPSPKALNVSASRSGGSVVVSFRTDSEIELAGFNILADVQGGKNRIQVNSQMIAPKGVSGAGASYTVSIPQGNLKGARTIYVESVTTSGAKILSDPARL